MPKFYAIEQKLKYYTIILCLNFEEPNIKIYWCVKSDIEGGDAELNITFHTQINLDIGLFKPRFIGV